MDKIRHKFTIEFNQLSIIHENQKDSFKKVIKALHDAIKSLEQPYDEAWQPIEGKYYDNLKEVIVEESLFLGNEGERSLNIFLSFLGQTILCIDDHIDDRPSDRMLRNLYEHLNYIAERIREYFRKRIGLSEESNPLWEVYLLAACFLINRYHFKDIDFPTKTILKFNFDISPEALIAKIKEKQISLVCP